MKKKKTNQQEFRIEKIIKIKDDELYVKYKGYDNSLNSWIDIKDLVWFNWLQFHWRQFHCIKRCHCFPKLYESFGGDIKVKVDLSIYAIKADIENISHVDASSFALKTN